MDEFTRVPLRTVEKMQRLQDTVKVKDFVDGVADLYKNYSWIEENVATAFDETTGEPTAYGWKGRKNHGFVFWLNGNDNEVKMSYEVKSALKKLLNKKRILTAKVGASNYALYPYFEKGCCGRKPVGYKIGRVKDLV